MNHMLVSKDAAKLYVIFPLLACALGLRFITLHLADPVMFDPQHTYLPAARTFLEQGWTFLLTPQSYRVAPLGYLWPALWQADPNWIRLANMGLWVCCVYFLWRTCFLLGGNRTAIISMILLAGSDLYHYFPSEMTEPIYLFGVFGLTHSLARLIVHKDTSFITAIQGGAMLSITLLSRPILQLIAITTILGCIITFLLFKIKQNRRHNEFSEIVLNIFFLLGIGLLLPLAVVIKNGLTFDFWGISTGAGVGLYLGTHILFQGTEPAFLGFDYDVNAFTGLAAQNGDPLSLQGDRAARQAALQILQEMPIDNSIKFFGRKLWWWLAYHPAEIGQTGGILRKIRLFEISALTVSTCLMIWSLFNFHRQSQPLSQNNQYPVISKRQWALFVVFWGILLALIAQLLPILYNSRYSTAILDPWLIPLAGFSLTCITSPVRCRLKIQKYRWSILFASSKEKTLSTITISLLFILASTEASFHLAQKIDRVAVDGLHSGPTLVLSEISSATSIHTNGMVKKTDHAWQIIESPAAIMIRADQKDVNQLSNTNLGNALWDTEMALSAKKKKDCRHAEISYQTATGEIKQPQYRLPLLLKLDADGKFHHLTTHANQEMRPLQPGSLRIVLHCPVGTIVQWRSTKLLESIYAADAAAHLHKQINH